MAELTTLVKDIYHVLDEQTDHVAGEDNLRSLSDAIIGIVRSRLRTRSVDTGSGLRFSNLGRPDRQLWYQANMKGEGEKLSPKTSLKFLYGDVIEQLLLFLAKEAGHEVTHEQEEIEVDGIKGHIDAIIDGTVVDVKSASPYSFKKFQDGSLVDNDPFGYIGQISGYASVLTPKEGGAFLAMDKVHGDITTLHVDGETVTQYGTEDRIAHLKEVVQQADPPPKCYTPVPEGKSGNMKLGVQCSYCAFKDVCWQDANGGKGLRTFIYSGGPVFLTHVEREPKAFEAL